MDLFVRVAMAHCICLLYNAVASEKTRATFIAQPPHFWPSLHHVQKMSAPNNGAAQSQRYLSLRHAIESGEEFSGLTEDVFSNGPLPWSCDCEFFWRDLGEGYLPRFVRDSECTRRTCWYGHFKCVPKTYDVTVLKHIATTELAIAEFGNQHFGDDYVFSTVNVTVNCQCERIIA